MNQQQIALFQSKASDDWATPRYLYEQLNNEFHFDMDPCPFTVNLKLKFKPSGDGVEFQAAIEFVAEKVKDDVKGQMREGQEDLFSQAEKKAIEPKKERLSHCNTTCLDCTETCQNFLCRRPELVDNVEYVDFKKEAARGK